MPVMKKYSLQGSRRTEQDPKVATKPQAQSIQEQINYGSRHKNSMRKMLKIKHAAVEIKNHFGKIRHNEEEN